MQDLREIALSRRHAREAGLFFWRRDRLHEPLRKLPARQERGAELRMIETKRVLLQCGEMAFFLDGAAQEAGVRLTQLLQQHENANVLQQAGDESLVACLV